MTDFTGTAEADTLRGTRGSDRLYGLDGKDLLLGGSGSDLIEGGDGPDVLRGGTGRDFLYGGNGGDKLYGGAGADWLAGGKGADHLAGGSGDDTFVFEEDESGLDTVTDFSAGDTLKLNGFNLMPFEFGLIARQVGDNVLVSYISYSPKGLAADLAPPPGDVVIADVVLVLNANADAVWDSFDLSGSFF